MAVITSGKDQRHQKFPFLRLAAELQRIVIEKYYEDDWAVEIEWIEGHPCYSWRSKSVRQPLPVSRQFYAEMKRALYASRSGILHHGFRISKSNATKARLNRFLFRKTPFDNAITRISIHSSALTHEYVDLFKRRYSNLDMIEVNNMWESHLIESWMCQRLQGIELLDLMAEKHDTALLKDFYEFIDCCVFKFIPLHLSRLGSIAVLFDMNVSDLVCQCSDPHCTVKDATMVMSIMISQGHAGILFRHIRPNFAHSLTGDDAMAHLRLQEAILDH